MREKEAEKAVNICGDEGAFSLEEHGVQTRLDWTTLLTAVYYRGIYRCVDKSSPP